MEVSSLAFDVTESIQSFQLIANNRNKSCALDFSFFLFYIYV